MSAFIGEAMKDKLIEQTRQQVTEDLKYRDGIPRIAVGVFLIVSMLMALAGNISTFVVFIPIIPGMVEGLRKRYTYPRVGYAKIREAQHSKGIIVLIAVSLIIGVFVALLGSGKLGFQLPSRAQVYGPLSIAVALPVVLIGFVVFARRRQRISLSIIVMLMFLALTLFLKPDRHTVYYIVIAFGALNLVIGIIELRKFLREYSEIPDE